MNRRPWPDSQKSQKSKFSFSSLNSFYLTLLFFFFIYLLLSAHLSFVSLSFLISIILLICRSYLSIYCSLSLCYYFTFLFIYLLSVTFSFCLSFFPFSLFLTFYYPILVFLPYQPRSLSLSLCHYFSFLSICVSPSVSFFLLCPPFFFTLSVSVFSLSLCISFHLHTSQYLHRTISHYVTEIPSLLDALFNFLPTRSCCSVP